MDHDATQSEPFAVKDCALAEIATGRRAQNLRELSEGLQQADSACIYYHFWGSLLRPRFVEPQFNNDFAAWVHRALHDEPLAERLAVINPTRFPNMEDVRMELLDVVAERLDESEYLPWAQADQLFYFMRSQIVVFDTHYRVQEPSELVEIIPKLPLGSIFYHFIDARRRTEGRVDDFRAWLSGKGCEDEYRTLCAALASIDPYFDSLVTLRRRVAEIFREQLGGTSNDIAA